MRRALNDKVTEIAERQERLGDRLRAKRIAASLSQEALARLAFVSVRTVIRIEQSHTVPRVDVLGRIASALGVTLDDLAGDELDGAA